MKNYNSYQMNSGTATAVTGLKNFSNSMLRRTTMLMAAMAVITAVAGTTSATFAAEPATGGAATAPSGPSAPAVQVATGSGFQDNDVLEDLSKATARADKATSTLTLATVQDLMGQLELSVKPANNGQPDYARAAQVASKLGAEYQRLARQGKNASELFAAALAKANATVQSQKGGKTDVGNQALATSGLQNKLDEALAKVESAKAAGDPAALAEARRVAGLLLAAKNRVLALTKTTITSGASALPTSILTTHADVLARQTVATCEFAATCEVDSALYKDMATSLQLMAMAPGIRQTYAELRQNPLGAGGSGLPDILNALQKAAPVIEDDAGDTDVPTDDEIDRAAALASKSALSANQK